MPDPKMMILAGVIVVIATKCNEIPVVELQIRPAEGNTIVKGENVMNLDIRVRSTVGLAADAMRLPRKMGLGDFAPMGAS